MNEVHVCPILMRTVIWSDGQCTENCAETEYPIVELKIVEGSDCIPALVFFALFSMDTHDGVCTR